MSDLMAATEIWDQFDTVPDTGPALSIKDSLTAMVRERDAELERSQQTDLGPSEIGNPCTYHLAQSILGIPEPDSDPWCRNIGTAVHAWLEEAAARWNVRHCRGDWVAESKVYPDLELLPSGGSADLYSEVHRAVVDHKVVGKTQQQKYRTNGPGEQYRRQAHLYGLGYSNAGASVEWVSIAFWLRGGRLSDLHVWVERYDEEVALETLDRFRTLKGLCETFGEAILDQLPRHPECYRCSVAEQ